MFEFHLKQFYFTWVLHLQLLHHVVVDAQSSMVSVPTYISSHHNWEPSIAITVGAIIFILLLMGIISLYIRKCTQSRFIITQTNSNTTNRPCSCSQGINKELLETFPILFFSNIKDLKTGKGPLECAVCLTDFKDQDTLRLLPKCNHVFHPQCIDSWLACHLTCPVCRANLNQDSCQVAITVPTQNQDSCQVAITVPTQLSNDQMGEEGSRIRAETQADEENEIESNPNPNPNPNQNPVVQNEGEGNCDDEVASKLNLSRSNSTGHVLVEPVKCEERYTLMLPEDVRRYILVNNERRVQLSSSCYNNDNVVKGSCCSDSEGVSIEKRTNGETMVERWVLCAPPFVALNG